MQNYLSSLFNNSAGNAFDSFSANYKKKTTPTAPASQPSALDPFKTPSAKLLPNTVGATTTTPTKPAAASSPAKSAYMQSLTSTQGPDLNTPITGNTTTPSGAVVNANTGATVSTLTPQPNDTYRSAFEAYIQSLKPSEDETRASKNLSALSLQAEKDQEEALSRGVTEGFATGEAARVNRNNSFGIRAASDALNAFTGNRTAVTEGNKARLDFEKSLRGDESAAAKTKFDQDLATKKFDEDKRQFGLSYALEQQKLNAPKPLSAAQEAAAIAKSEKAESAQQSASQSLGLINGLLNGKRYKAISGATQTGSIPFLGDRAAVNEYDQLQGLLKLGVRSLIKGQGAVSDYEGKVLGQAASALSRLTSEAEFEKALKKVRGVLQTNNGGETEVIIKDKNGKVVGQGMLTGDDIYEAVNDGNSVDYL